MPALDFKGKSFIYTHHLGVPYRELLVVPEKSCPAEGRPPALDDNRDLLEREDGKDDPYRFEDAGGVFRLSDCTCGKTAGERHKLHYEIENPNTGAKTFPKRTRVWACSQEEHQRNVERGLVSWGKDGTAQVPSFTRSKDSLKGGGGTVPSTWWDWTFAGHTDEAPVFADVFLRVGGFIGWWSGMVGKFSLLLPIGRKSGNRTKKLPPVRQRGRVRFSTRRRPGNFTVCQQRAAALPARRVREL